jgi:hypothetical protein
MPAINFHDALTTASAAALLNAKKATLEKWRVLGTGPAYYRIGGRVYYFPEDIQRYIESQRREENNAA